jgi:membrane-associated phospholipid phosphatase
VAAPQVRVEPRAPFLAWPGWAHLRYAGLLSILNTLWFLIVYGGADALTARRNFRVPVNIPGELRIPFIPAMTAAYMSVYLLFLMAPFILRTRREFRAAVRTMAFVILCGGIAFLLLPAELAFAPPSRGQLGGWAGLYRVADALNLTYNLLPSLHVAFAVVCVALFAPRASKAVQILLWSWAVLIAASTVLIHQHHVLDVIAGWLLAMIGVRKVFQPGAFTARTAP